MMIDLRSDTVTRPSAAMRKAMALAEVGDDVFGEDPTVNRLQESVAALLGKEAALFVPSGTMANQLCIKVHTDAGDEVIAERGAHVFNYETGGAAFLSRVQVHPVDGVGGVMDVEMIRRAVRPELYYMPRTSLVCLENTHNRAGGTIQPLSVIASIRTFTQELGIRMHLDGARLWNACAATGIAPGEYAKYFDSVSVCLSKGLGAPVGSLITGSRDVIRKALHFRKIFGGGMRQAGVLAAAGLFALEHNRDRLQEDHEKASDLARELSDVPGFLIDTTSVQTNIIVIDVTNAGVSPEVILSSLRDEGVLLSAGNYMGLRAVTHLDVSMKEVKLAADLIRLTMKRLYHKG